jgi:nicotinamide riboside transporter PnuC
VCSLLSVFAQFLMTRKVLENWTLWIIADIVYIGVHSITPLVGPTVATSSTPGADARAPQRR